MNFRIADTFTDSLTRLTNDEQKAVKTTAFDLQMNPAQPSLSFHKLDRARDKHFWSVRVSRDIRLIVHKTDASLLLCYVDHHDDAYGWAERRKLEVHPTTGAAQLVEVRETIHEIVVPLYVPEEVAAAPKPKLFPHLTDETLLSYGVPPEWLSDVRAADEDTLLVVADPCPPKPPRRCSNSPRAARRASPCRWRRARVPSTIPTRSAASAPCTAWRSCNAPWIFPGTSGPCSWPANIPKHGCC